MRPQPGGHDMRTITHAMGFYGDQIDGLTELAARSANGAIAPDRATDASARAPFARGTPGRALVGRDVTVLALVKHYLENSWFEAMLSRDYGVVRVSRERAATGQRESRELSPRVVTSRCCSTRVGRLIPASHPRLEATSLPLARR